MSIKAGIWLDCGCCGCGFQTWEGYVDQDQDYGYGICRSCQGDIEDHNNAEVDKILNAIKPHLNQEEIERMDALSAERRNILANYLLSSGKVEYKIGVSYGVA